MMFLFAGHSDKPLKSLVSMAHKGNHICLYHFSFIYIMDDLREDAYICLSSPKKAPQNLLSTVSETPILDINLGCHAKIFFVCLQNWIHNICKEFVHLDRCPSNVFRWLHSSL